MFTDEELESLRRFPEIGSRSGPAGGRGGRVGPWDRLLNDAGWDVGLRPPAALGVEGAGRVLAVGADVDEFAVGDRVLAHEAPLPGGSGFWAERVLITAAHAAACPHGLDPVLAGGTAGRRPHRVAGPGDAGTRPRAAPPCPWCETAGDGAP